MSRQSVSFGGFNLLKSLGKNIFLWDGPKTSDREL
jgi:hypothetical protein